MEVVTRNRTGFEGDTLLLVGDELKVLVGDLTLLQSLHDATVLINHDLFRTSNLTTEPVDSIQDAINCFVFNDLEVDTF